jgi:hypothetical protein
MAVALADGAARLVYGFGTGRSKWSLRVYINTSSVPAFAGMGLISFTNSLGYGFGPNIAYYASPTQTLNGITLPAMSVWYRIELYFETNATSKFSIYDAAGALVGENTFVATEVPHNIIFYGNNGTNNITSLMDNLVIDWTNATYPIGP